MFFFKEALSKSHSNKITGLFAVTSVFLLFSQCSSLTMGRSSKEEIPISLAHHHSFRFMNKWRIHHDWITGPAQEHEVGKYIFMREVDNCRFYQGNDFVQMNYLPYSKIRETENPLVEKDGRAYWVVATDAWNLEEHRHVYLMDTEGTIHDKNGNRPFCDSYFAKPFVHIELYLVETSPKEKIEEWTKGAVPRRVNGLNWLYVERPIAMCKERVNHVTDEWFLYIPQTKYLIDISFSTCIDEQGKKGPAAFPVEHAELKRWFYRIIESVRLDPLDPIPLEDLVTIDTEKYYEQQRKNRTEFNRIQKYGTYEEKKQQKKEVKEWIKIRRENLEEFTKLTEELRKSAQ